MTSLFLASALGGAVVLVLQIVLSLLGLGGGHDVDGAFHIGEASFTEGLELLSVRSIAAGAAAFGVIGLGMAGLPGLLAVPLAIAGGVGAMVGTALLTRQILRLESDGSLMIGSAVGTSATVYVPIPAEQRGQGKIQLMIQGRTVELAAVTTGRDALPTGMPVIVVSVIDSETVEVIPASTIQEVLDVNG